jgi:hypothetical protein
VPATAWTRARAWSLIKTTLVHGNDF